MLELLAVFGVISQTFQHLIQMAGLFIDEGPVVQVKNSSAQHVFEDPFAGILYDGPLIVLVSHLSASASEIVAAALQDHGRALVIGLGAGSELRRPMALVVIGGLVTSTLLTLLVVPAVYALLDRGR